MNKNYKFGLDEGVIINDLDIKTKIIDYLFNSIELSKFRFKMLDNISQLEYLKENIHYISPNFKGYNYFLIFIKIKDISYCVILDKKRITYQKSKLNVKMTKIIKLNITANNAIFRGSIFDCKFIQNNNNFFMIIKDCYKLMGNSLLHMEMNEKLSYLNNIITNQIYNNPYFDIKFNKLYKYDELTNLINKIIPSCKFDIQGLVFFPSYSGITVIYTNNKKKCQIESNCDIEYKSYDLIKDIIKILNNRIYYYEKNKKIKTFLLEKTDISDVYNMFEDDNKIGIAHIPNIKTSQFCKNQFDNCKSKKFNCVYDNKFKKWIPLCE